MAKLIGVVSKVVGEVFAVANDGTRRQLSEGDRLFAGEQLETGAAGAVAVHLQNGAELTLGRDSSLELSPQLLANQAPQVDTPEAQTPSQAQLTDVEKLQQAIAAGADPSQEADPTAAGPGSGGSSGALGGGHSFVMLSEVAGRVDPTIGFPTAGFNGFAELADREFGLVTDNDDIPPVVPDVDNPVTLDGLEVAGGGLTFNEANLAQGSASDATALTQTGSFTVVAPDGVFNLNIGGINVVTAGAVTGVGQSIVTGLGNVLTITGYNPATGVVSYSYTLTGAETHPGGNGSLGESISVSVSDTDGDVASGSLNITVIDDAPRAVDDSNPVSATENQLTLTGNVLSNDVQGADRIASGPITPQTIQGTYGTLVLAADGSYTYTLNTNDPDFINLHGGGSGVESFTYTLKDADGDTSTATLKLNVSNLNDPVTLNGLNLEGGALTVFEKNLSDGSNPDNAALTQSGSFTVTAPDGLQTLTIGGITVVSSGSTVGFPQSAVTPQGNTLTITGYNASTGVVTYTYTLLVTEAHAAGNGISNSSESFTVVATDTDGSSASGSINVNIVDDKPTAVNDSNLVTATENQLTLTGNVLSNDVQGADRITSGPITPQTIQGTYGTLVLAADGSYTYTLNSNDPDFINLHGGGNGVETFTYTLKDADGDTSTATLQLNVSNLNDPVTLNGLNVEGGEVTVFEKNLSDGSSPNNGALTQGGSFTVTAPDGLQTLTVGGITVVSNGSAVGFPQSTVTPQGNTLTITGYNASTGVVTYTYTLLDNEAHASGNGANNLSESFTVVATDTDGSSASGSIDVNIVDDMPAALDDTNASTATEAQLTLTGNVLTNDVQGADRITSGPITPQTIQGTYGTLVLAADGTYTYTLNSNDPDFINLHGGGNGVETFTYTLKDADGDTSTATLQLNVSNLNDPVTLNGLNVEGGEVTVFEKNLSDGSSPNNGALTQGGSFTVTAPDGLQTLTVGGITVVSNGSAVGFPQSTVTPQGNTLTITGYNASTGVVTYTYTLLDNEAHASGNGANNLSESFTVVATDTDGSSASGSIDVNIVDDTPAALDDTNASTATEAQLTLTGNVLTNDVQGADRITSGPITPQTIQGTYGTLVLAADGSYTYTLNSNDPDFINLHGGGNGVETFTYTLKDADGDTSTATLQLNVSNLNDPVTLNGLNVEGGEVTVFEKNLSDGSSPNNGALTQGGSFTVTAPDGLQTLTVGGITVVSNGSAVGFPQSTVTPQGNTLTITGYNASTGVVTYTYTLLDNEAHASGNGANNLSESFTVVATDTDGSSASGSIDVNIVDDMPKAIDDVNPVTATENQTVLTGNVLTNDIQGADRITSGPITPQTIQGTYGTLVLAADGTYTYTLNSNDPDFINLHGGGNGIEVFTYTLKDADGDTSTANLKLNISNLNDPVVINGLDICGGELTFYEKNLSDGSSPDQWALTKGGTFTVVAPDGLQSLTIGGVTIVSGGVAVGLPLDATTPLGNTFTIHSYDPVTGLVTGTYTLTDNETHPNANGTNTLVESFEVVAVDKDGSSATGSIDINIVDDVPKAIDDVNPVTATENQTVLTGNVLTNDIQGADRITSGPITPQTIQGTYGTLVLAADGTYTYTLNSNDPDFINLHGGGNGIEVFTYTLKDADGDTSTANLKLNISNLNDPVVINGLDICGGELTFYEKNLSDGSSPDQWALTKGGTFTVVAPDGLQSLTIGGVTIVSGGVAVGLPLDATTPLGNTFTIHSYDPVTGLVTGTYTLTDNETHPNANGTNTLVESFEVVAVDKDGSSATGSIDINIVDDVPKAVDDVNPVTATENQLTLTGNVLTNDIQGADRITSGPITPQTIQGTYGTLVLAADGTYTYTLNSNDPDFINLHGGGNGIEVFTYTLKDADGDTSTANLKLNISNLNDPVVINGLDICGGELTFYEKNLSDGSSPDQWALTKGGTFTVVAPDGLQTLTIAGVTIVSGGVAVGLPLDATTPLGNTFTIHSYDPVTGLVTGTYTLTDNETHPNANGTNTLVESFEVVAVDKDGNSDTASIDINIVDDVPKAVDDVNPVTATENQTVLTGNVLTNDIQGADRITSGPITPQTIQGTYGTLVLAADGTYTYTLNSNDPDFINLHGGGNGIEVFTYTLKDADGDTSTANLKLNISNLNDPVVINGLDICGGELTFYEKNLSDGSSPDQWALTKGGTFTVVAPDGLQSLTIAGVTIVSGGVAVGLPLDATTPLGNTFTIHSYDPVTGLVTGTYTLTDNETHPNANGTNTLVESFEVVAVDKDGNSDTASIDINIVDDVPKATDDTNPVAASEHQLTLTGNVLTNDIQGADRISTGPGTGPITPQTIQGTYGTLVLAADGTYTYTLNTSDPDFINLHGGGSGVETFTYTLKDADGDTSKATLTLNVSNSDHPVTIDGLNINGGELTVYEKNLSDGTSPDESALTRSGSFTVTAPDGLQTLTVGSITLVSGGVVSGIPQTGVTPLGNALTITGYNPSTGVVSYTYTLKDSEGHANGNGINSLNEAITVKATDTDGSTKTATIDVNIVDDVPSAVGAERSVTPGQVDSNLLLTIDVSGSMNDGSGVSGLSRLQLAKQAISVLLDKYDEMGDVKVQIVTFSSGSSVKASSWVSVADAKAIVAGLSAGGGTNYDEAVSGAKSAFNTAGKLTGAQNIGYFFSDGEPSTSSQGIDATDEASWKSFLDSNGIKSYAIGLGNGVNAGNLNPLAYDGSTHTNTNANVVTDLNQLNEVLSGTVQGAPVTGSLMSGGEFGADGGFIKSLLIDGTTYTFDPKGNSGAGSYATSGAADRGTFDSGTNSITVKTALGGSIVVDMDTGDFTYTPPKDVGSTKVEQIGFVVSDNDGDTSSATLVVNVHTNTGPVAGADHVITNILSNSISLPGEALLANDSDANNDPLSAAQTTFNTGWVARGGDFTVGSTTPTVLFNGTSSNNANNQLLNVARGSFTGPAASMTAAVVVSGFLGSVSNGNANDEDLITVTLKQGEKLTLNHDRLANDNLLMEWKEAGGTYQAIGSGDGFTASHDGVYTIHLANRTNLSGGSANTSEYYKLTMSINYADAQDSTPTHNGSYTVSDGHGGTSTGAVDINYQAGDTLNGTGNDDVLVAGNTATTLNGGDGNDVLVGGSGNDTLHGGNGNDLLIGGLGNDLLDGGAGIDTASYASASSAVTVNLNLAGGQNTLGAGTDTLASIENLIGSDYNDSLTGNSGANLLIGGKGNDTLLGGGGDDVLIGGPGNNTLTGGSGADTFLWQQGNTGHDVVTDFTPGTDRLDLSQLLQGENPTSASLDDYLHFKVTGSGSGVVSTIEVSVVAGAAPTQTIDLAGVNLAQHYGVTAGAGGVVAAGQDTATIINGMLNDHSLKVDTV
ncbi:retention module-containing protein [Pseudomonas sp. H9]|uniref:retention module-containing protein n=1 Tax=Pseudomonas sp. H9 TaxID=483968 RepID=UPI0010579D15|nr:retention module-containing protein [Pseudomonas sp. H9]TDF77600.1 retention module-containing protein [Pseudomonas sp. H9]